MQLYAALPHALMFCALQSLLSRMLRNANRSLHFDVQRPEARVHTARDVQEPRIKAQSPICRRAAEREAATQKPPRETESRRRKAEAVDDDEDMQ